MRILPTAANASRADIGPTVQDPVAQLLCAETAVTIEECKLAFNHTIAALTGYAERGETPPLQERMRLQVPSELCGRTREPACGPHLQGGGRVGHLYREQSVRRFLADINVGRQHVNNQFEPAGRNWGRVMLGGSEAENRDIFLVERE